MCSIHIQLIVFVADYTSEYQEISGIGMAIRTGTPGFMMRTAIDGEVLLIMVKKGIPVNCCMANFTVYRESCQLMIGISGAKVIILMAEETFSRSSGKLTINMTELTRYRYMCSGEGKRRLLVVESCR